MCRLIGFGGIAYIISGVIFAVGGGTVHNILTDKMSFKAALFRNVLIIIPIAAITGIMIVLDK